MRRCFMDQKVEGCQVASSCQFPCSQTVIANNSREISSIRLLCSRLAISETAVYRMNYCFIYDLLYDHDVIRFLDQSHLRKAGQ